jgi:NAD(P)-dependent dehydrogenase (short-subunit alcohol dehydrogenase family)
MAQQVALVTGASSGIGEATARILARNGYYVFAAARRAGKLESLRSDTIEPLPLDVTQSASVEEAVKHAVSSKGGIDVLINNAGYGLFGTIEGVSQEAVRHAFEVNVFGVGRMIQSVLPIMRAQRSGIIVNISSVVGKVGLPVFGWYAATKHAVEGMTDALRLETKRFGIRVVLVEPGSTSTGFESIAFDTLAQSRDPEAYQALVAKFVNQMRKNYQRASGPDPVAAAIYKAVSSRNPRPRYVVGRYALAPIHAKRLLGDRIFDWIVGRYLT